MKNTNQEFPDEIISMLLHHTWSTLTSAQKAKVEPYFSQQEYEVLHDAMQIKQVDEESAKVKLMSAFDHHHKRTTASNVKIWRVAAMILLFGVAALQLAILTQHKTTEMVTQIIRDTVIIEQQATAAPIHTYDTVYLTPASTAKQVIKPERNQTQLVKSTPQNRINNLQPDVYITPIEALKETPNTRRKNSIKTDSAFQRLTFVTL